MRSSTPSEVYTIGKNLLEFKRGTQLSNSDISTAFYAIGNLLNFSNHKLWLDFIQKSVKSKADLMWIASFAHIACRREFLGILDYYLEHKKKAFKGLTQKLITAQKLGILDRV